MAIRMPRMLPKMQIFRLLLVLLLFYNCRSIFFCPSKLQFLCSLLLPGNISDRKSVENLCSYYLSLRCKGIWKPQNDPAPRNLTWDVIVFLENHWFFVRRALVESWYGTVYEEPMFWIANTGFLFVNCQILGSKTGSWGMSKKSYLRRYSD